ncbi:hypothetical protein ES707_05633 [subsurface metagenome]
MSEQEIKNRVMKLQLSNGYYLRFDHLSRLLHYVAGKPEVSRFSQKELYGALGMSPRMIENLTSYGVALELLTRGSCKPTELGVFIDKEDIFFDKAETLWFLHYTMASDRKYVVWNRLANCVFPKESKVSTEVARTYFSDLNGHFSEKSLKKHLAKEIQSFFNAYTEQKFIQLKYIHKLSDTTYKLNESVQVPDLCILASCYLYRDRYAKGATGIEIEHLVKEKNSPGRVFHISEHQLRLALERLHTERRLSIESRANLDQIRFRPNERCLDIVKQFYEG